MLRHRNEFPAEGELPGFDGATAWLNSAPLTPAGLRGQVVLVSFGTYTCINWIRSLPPTAGATPTFRSTVGGRSGVFADERVREAFLLTLPRQQVVTQLLGELYEDAAPQSSFLVPQTSTQYGQIVSENGSDAYSEPDPDAAAALLLLRGPWSTACFRPGAAPPREPCKGDIQCL